MQRYQQRSLVYPGWTLLLWGVIAIAAVMATGALDSVLNTIAGVETSAAAAAGAVVVVAALVFRSWQGVVATVLAVICSLAVTYAAASLLGLAVAMPPRAVIAIASVLGMQYASYVAFAHRERLRLEHRHSRPPPRDRRFIVSEALRDVRGAVVLSAVCAAIGFAALRSGTGFLAIAAVVTAIAVMTIVPAVMAVAPPALAPAAARGTLEGLGRFAAARPAMLLAIAGALVAAGVVAARHELAGSLGTAGLAVALVWVVAIVALGSLTLGTVALVLAVAPLVWAFALLRVLGQPAGAAAQFGVIALGLLASDPIRCFKRQNALRRRPAADPAHTVSAVLAQVGAPLVATPLIVALGFATLFASGIDTAVATAFVAMAATTLIARLVCMPAAMAMLGRRGAQPPLAEDMSVINDFRKQTADEKRPTFADYSDAEIMNLTTADFLALAGKTVIRQGGSNGTRRLLVELDIQPHARILELGAGVGATAFDVVANDPTVRVTGIDLSAFMVEKARKRAEAQDAADRKRRRTDRREEPRIALGERVAFVHGRDPNVLPFDDNTFDVVIVESVAMYNNTERFFREALRVLKPGGRLGLHDWCWVDKPSPELEVTTCIVACGCNPGDVKFFNQADWEGSLRRQGFEIAFAEEYPFTFFSWSDMRDDEGTWRLLKMFGRVLSRRATARRMLRMMAFLARREGMFGYTITIAKPAMLAPGISASHPRAASQLPASKP
jgi:SAM-dependent methyltransferase